tara:strand:- start:386 stop:487 length:102 start_codon:yes stop_codon:yes gene_type:complete
MEEVSPQATEMVMASRRPGSADEGRRYPAGQIR